jgi:F5/8 type C domain
LLTSEFCPSSATFPVWWLVDLGAVYGLVETDINFEHFSSYYKYKIDVSTDSASWTTIVDHSNNTTRRGGTMTDASNGQARYVRLTISGSSEIGDSGCFWEFLVWGYNTPG